MGHRYAWLKASANCAENKKNYLSPAILFSPVSLLTYKFTSFFANSTIFSFHQQNAKLLLLKCFCKAQICLFHMCMFHMCMFHMYLNSPARGVGRLWHDFKQLTHWAILVTTGTLCSCICWMEKSVYFGYYAQQTGTASSLFVATKADILEETCGEILVMFGPRKPGILIKWFLHLNLSRL